MTRPMAAFAAALLGLLLTASAHAEDTTAASIETDIVAGEEAYQSVCRNCHGPKAQGLASFPKLSDAEPAHLSMRLEQYRAGERVGPNSPLMWPVAEELSDADIANIVAYITETFG